MSEMDTVMAARVEYLYPIALISSRTSAVFVAPCVLITFSRICFNPFLPTWKSTSSFTSFPGIVLSTKPRSCGRISLKMKRPNVDSTLPVTTVPSASVLLTRTIILDCNVTPPFS